MEKFFLEPELIRIKMEKENYAPIESSVVDKI